MSPRDELVVPNSSELPASLRAPAREVSLADYVFVEAARLDGIDTASVLAWLGLTRRAFESAEESWSDRLADELARDGSTFDELYEELLGRALSTWARTITPLHQDVAAYMTYLRHTSAAGADELPRRLGLTDGDEIRLARSWRARLTDPALAARAEAAWSAPLAPLPELALSPLTFPPSQSPALSRTEPT